MAFDGITTFAMVEELKHYINLGKIEKIYQPQSDELVFHIHSKSGNYKLFASSNPSHSRVHLITENLVNPPSPSNFCMLLRKHLQGGRITEINQIGSERILEISIQSQNELGFSVSKKLIFEIMGKHSNIILVDIETGKVIDSIKRISFDVNRVRQILPGILYEYPPKQDKIPFKEIDEEAYRNIPNNSKALLKSIGGISPMFCDELELKIDGFKYLKQIIENVKNLKLKPVIYRFENKPVAFYSISLDGLKSGAEENVYPSLSNAIEIFFNEKEWTNQARQKAHDILKSINSSLDKLYLKKKKLNEELIAAENSDDMRLYGELITANLHLIKQGMDKVKVMNYYNGEELIIPLDVKASPNKNAQSYFKKYSKAKTAVKEKKLQLIENQKEIDFLESELTFIDSSNDYNEIEAIKRELIETGYIKRRQKKNTYKEKVIKPKPNRFTLSNGMECFVGKNNKENEYVTFKLAGKGDIWLHTKDIPGSHVIIKAHGAEVSGDILFEAAAIAAYFSKGRESENVPVDYVPIKFVKKPQGAKIGMVIFTNNKTLWVDPKLPTNDLTKSEN